MNRPMMPNPAYSTSNAHGRAHDERNDCMLGEACEPYPDGYVLVAAPGAGIIVVEDGTVLDVKPADVDVMRHQLGPTGPVVTTYTVTVRAPKPECFEAGKTYRRFTGWSIRAQAADVTERFECTAVEKDGDGRPVAFGRFTTDKGGQGGTGIDHWYLMHRYQWKNDRWAEEALSGSPGIGS